MNCETFEVILDDLVTEQPIDVSIRFRGLEHAATCARCAGKLTDARLLNAALRALAASDESKQASPALEVALQAAFCQRRPAKRVVRSRLVWALSAVAALILVIFAVTSRYRHRVGVGQTRRASAARIASSEHKLTAKTPIPARPAETTRSTTHKARHRDVRKPNREKAVGEPVWATEFLPLPYAGGSDPFESGDVVRIRLPRSALGSLGLPVNEEQAGEAVTADVLIGDDGVARAISFVR